MTRTLLRNYAGTILPLVAGLAAVVLGWVAVADTAVVGGRPWVSVAAAGAAWLLAAAVWLRRRGWRAVPIHAVTWVAPLVVLAAPAAVGWLSADGLVLWAPAITVVAVSLGIVMTGPGTFVRASSWAPPQHRDDGGIPWVSQRGVTGSATSSAACRPRPSTEPSRRR